MSEFSKDEDFLQFFLSSQLSNVFFIYVKCGSSYSVCADGRTDSHQEPNTRLMEICVVPDIVHCVIYWMEQSHSTEDNSLRACEVIPAFYKIRKFITAVKSAHQLSLF